MSKLAIGIIAGIIVAGVVTTGIIIYVNSQPKDTVDASTNTQQTQNVTLVDPDGVYDLFSDPSITKAPEAGVLFGNGQTLTWEYDGSKSENDPYAKLSYQLFYIQDNGDVQPMGGGNVAGENGKGTFTLSDNVFNSSAKGQNGFLELVVTWGTTFNGESYDSKEEKLGMYSVKYDVTE